MLKCKVIAWFPCCWWFGCLLWPMSQKQLHNLRQFDVNAKVSNTKTAVHWQIHKEAYKQGFGPLLCSQPWEVWFHMHQFYWPQNFVLYRGKKKSRLFFLWKSRLFYMEIDCCYHKLCLDLQHAYPFKNHRFKRWLGNRESNYRRESSHLFMQSWSQLKLSEAFLLIQSPLDSTYKA